MNLKARIVLTATKLAIRCCVLEVKGETPQSGSVDRGNTQRKQMPENGIVVLKDARYPVMVMAARSCAVSVVPAVLAVLAAELAVLPARHRNHWGTALHAVDHFQGCVVLNTHRTSVFRKYAYTLPQIQGT